MRNRVFKSCITLVGMISACIADLNFKVKIENRKSKILHRKAYGGQVENKFTLVELLCVCGILIFLMGIGIGIYSAANRSMGEKKCKSMIASMSIALENYKSKVGYYPQASTQSYFYVDKYGAAGTYSLNSEIPIPDNQLVPKPHTDISAWTRGAWKDPFGNKFLYQCPGKHNPTSYDLHSPGPDQSGTITSPGADDISNWTQ